MAIKKYVVMISFQLLTTLLFGQQLPYHKMLDRLLSHTVPEISVQDAATLTNTIFLDARPIAEYNVSHLHNAIRVGFSDFSLSKLTNISKASPIVIYCSVGYRSEKIAEKMAAEGFTNIKNMYGGIFEWANLHKPMYDSAGLTKNVHPYNKKWGKWLTHTNKNSSP